MDTNLLYIIIAAASILSVLSLANLWQTFSMRKLLKVHQAKLKHVEHQLKILSGGSIGVGQRLMDIEAKFRHLIQRQEELENSDPKQNNYEQATKLVERGASIQEVAQTCKISHAEAELVVSLVQLNQHKNNAVMQDVS